MTDDRLTAIEARRMRLMRLLDDTQWQNDALNMLAQYDIPWLLALVREQKAQAALDAKVAPWRAFNGEMPVRIRPGGLWLGNLDDKEA